MKKILIDTDIGDDIDDALAIAYALNNPKLDVLGITTAFKAAHTRAKMVAQMLHTFGRQDIPIATGVSEPLISPADKGWVPPQWDPADAPFQEPPAASLDAVSFIIQMARQNPGLAIAAIAPLTNIAMAVRLAPEVMRDVELWIMGGMYTRSFPEWNILCDPEAAQIVLASHTNIHIVGLDVTMQCAMTPQQVKAIAPAVDAPTQLLYHWTKKWQNDPSRGPILHDPLLIAAIQRPDLLTFADKELHVECGGAYSRGITVENCDPFGNRQPNPNVKMAVDVDGERFMQMFLKTTFPSTF